MTGEPPLVKGTPPRRRWKGILLVGLSAVAGIGFCLVGIGAIYSWYQHRPLPPRNWREISLPAGGIKVTLKTQWRDGLVQYKFNVVPKEPSLSRAFDKAVRSDQGAVRFTAHLRDKSGFALCGIDMDRFSRQINDTGIAIALLAEGNEFGCSRSEYKDVEDWDVSFHFPELELEKEQKEVKGTAASSSSELAGTDMLTGFSYMSGHLETRTGHTFVLDREAEHGTALMWEASQALKFTCKTKSECLIENLERKEAVHGRMLR
jgi:hypothetical protein